MEVGESGPFGRGLRWLGCHSPLRGYSSLAALPTSKNPRSVLAMIFFQALFAFLICHPPPQGYGGTSRRDKQSQPMIGTTHKEAGGRRRATTAKTLNSTF
jgi:hypothetical protein